MANKPLSMLLIRRLLQLKGQGSSNRQIAMILRVSRNTLNTYMARIDQCSSIYTDLLKLSDEAPTRYLTELDGTYLDRKGETGKGTTYVIKGLTKGT